MPTGDAAGTTTTLRRLSAKIETHLADQPQATTKTPQQKWIKWN
jgi:hypothetical protein